MALYDAMLTRTLLSAFVVFFLLTFTEHSDADNDENGQTASLIIYRTGSFAGAAYDNLVYMDGRPIGIFELSSFVELDVSPGVHHVWTTTPAHRPTMHEININPGETVFVRTRIGSPAEDVSRNTQRIENLVFGYERKEVINYSPPRLFMFPE